MCGNGNVIRRGERHVFSTKKKLTIIYVNVGRFSVRSANQWTLGNVVIVFHTTVRQHWLNQVLPLQFLIRQFLVDGSMSYQVRLGG